MTDVFDDIVFGGGKGGKSLAMTLAASGHRVALVERGQIGGTCINVACIPTKTMVASAKVVDTARHAAEFGVDLAPPVPVLADVVARKDRIVQGMVDTHWQLFTTTPGMELVLGEARFTGPKQLEVRAEDGTVRTLLSERVFINTGSSIIIPPIPGLDTVPYLTSTTVMQLTELPDHLVIVGAGYIALEFAQIFARLGSRVTLLDRGTRFLPREDPEIADAICELLLADGIEILLDTAVESVSTAGVEAVEVTVTRAGTPATVTGSRLLVAVGRRPVTDGIGLEAAGVEVSERGGIAVDDRLRTNVPGIWALGDCNGGPMFTHASWDDYRIVRDNVLHGADRSTADRLMPYTLFIDPELGRVGLTEEQARRSGRDILVATLPAGKIPRAQTSGEPKGLLKAVVDAGTGEILGCSLLCHNAGEVLSVVQVAMIGGLTADQVERVVFTHPTMAESLNLLFGGLG